MNNKPAGLMSSTTKRNYMNMGSSAAKHEDLSAFKAKLAAMPSDLRARIRERGELASGGK
jgi:hypothetical protein